MLSWEFFTDDFLQAELLYWSII